MIEDGRKRLERKKEYNISLCILFKDRTSSVPIVADEDMQYFSKKHQRIITPNKREKGIFHCDEEGINEDYCDCGCENPIPVLQKVKR